MPSDPMIQQAFEDVARALHEDIGEGDLTCALIPEHTQTHAYIIAREPAVLCGVPWVEAALKQCEPHATWQWHVTEGDACQTNQIILTMQGLARGLLSAERVALNFLQTLSAVATKTAQYVHAVRGTQAAIVDTRKTLPGLRVAQKYAVKVGGGVNHRMGLYDAILIKENHIAAAGGVAEVLQAVAQNPHIAQNAQFIEIEVETLAQLEEALLHGARMILLDNMPPALLHQAVALAQQFALTHGVPRAILEISGGVQLATVTTLAQTGVDRISIGGLTKDVKAIDFSMRFQETPI